MMRKIINSTYITLDGVVEGPHHWPALPEGPAAESDEIQADLLRHCDAVLMGRRTYEVFAPVWPVYEGEVADRMNAAEKLIVSSTLTEPAWGPATVIKNDVAGAIRSVKERPGGDIVQYGFGPVTQLLLEHDLLDELHLWVYPLLIGQPDTSDLIATHTQARFLQPAGTQTLTNGIVILRYHVSNPS